MKHSAKTSARRWWLVPVIALYLIAALALAWLSRFQLNPDAIAYIENARHWAHGDFALAVNSWWGPLLSWLLVPAVWARVDPVLAAKLLNLVFGVGFAGGVQALVRELTGGRGSRIAFVAGLLLALVMVPEPLTPDLLLTCVLTWYFALAMRLFRSESSALAVATGLVGGLAYLAKAYALPFVALHLTMTMLLKVWLKKPAVIAASRTQYAMGLAAFVVVIAPWVGAISVRDGTVTISSAGRHVTAWSVLPVPKPRGAHQELDHPREGRLTSWENPVEVRRPWSLWSPFDGRTGLRYQATMIRENLRRLPQFLNTADVWGLLPVSFVFAVVFLLPLRETLKTDDGIQRVWACLSVLLYLGGCVVLVMSSRYLWPIRGLLLALAIAGPGVRWRREVEDARIAAGRTLVLWHRVLVIVLVICIGLKVEETFDDWRGPLGKHAVSAAWKQAGEGFVPGCRFAATHYSPGLYATYWARGVYLGEVVGKTPEAIALELAPFGGVTLLVYKDDALGAALASSARFPRLDLQSPVFEAFGFAGGDCPPRARR